jgi:uncharacterized tellurite resistance protein B-like protein
MFSFLKGAQKPATTTGVEHLRRQVRAHLPEADEATLRIVVAIAGLLAAVAYADRELSDSELQHARRVLAEIEGLHARGADAICAVLREHIVDIASINPQAFTRDLREHADVAVRREVLDLLVDLAAADGQVSLSETDLLRRTTSALGLEANDYVVSQARHRDKLTLLR